MGTNMLTDYEWAIMLRTELGERMLFKEDKQGALLSNITLPLNRYIEHMETIQRESRK